MNIVHKEAPLDKQKPNKRKAFWIAAFILLNVVVIALAGMSEFGNSENAAKLTDITVNGWWLVPAILCFVVATTLDIYKYKMVIGRLSKKGTPEKSDTWKVARRTVLLGKYYDNITPAAIGGQPFQIYYLRKNSGLAKGSATSTPIFGMISTQIAFIAIALICFLFGNVIGNNPVLYVTAWIGLLFYAFWPVMVAGTSLFPKATARFIQLIVKLLAKVRIVKDRKRALLKVEEEVAAYARSVNEILKTRGLFVRAITISLCYNFLIATIPFFVLTAFGGTVGFWECFGMTVAVMSSIYFIPTPGNSGAAEGTFFLVFSALSKGYIFWAMLVWRLFSYYIYIIMGIIIYGKMQFERKRDKIT